MQKLIFATHNHAKFEQMAFVIRALKADIELVSAHEQFGDAADYEEQGSTAFSVAHNAARTLSQRLDVPVMTEDTTFHVDALDGEPGIRAGAYLREEGRAGILEALDGKENRRAMIVSAASWASPSGDAQTWETALTGRIARRERYRRGMPSWVAPSDENPLGGGYNAIFIPEGLRQTLAEIPPEDAIHYGYREPNFCAAIAFLQDR